MINNNTQNLKYAILEFERHCTGVSAGVCDCLHYLSLNAFCIIPDCFCFCFFLCQIWRGPGSTLRNIDTVYESGKSLSTPLLQTKI